MPHYTKAITKNGNSRLEITLTNKKLELSSIEFSIEHRAKDFSESKVRAWKHKKRQLIDDIKFLTEMRTKILDDRKNLNYMKKLMAGKPMSSIHLC